MLTKLIASIVLSGALMVTGHTAYTATGGCCFPGSDCCFPGSDCCDAISDCCSQGNDCCTNGESCCIR